MRIDHIVWYGAALAAGRKHFADRMDAAPRYGGEHPGEGTANAVLALGPETYLEILGRDPAQGEEGMDAEVRALSGQGLYHWAVGGIDLSALADRAKAAGLSGGQMVAGGRRLPDGAWLGWTCWGLRDHGFGALMPFFIDWGDSAHPAASAPNGGTLASFEIVTPDAAALRAAFTALGLTIAVSKGPEAAAMARLASASGETVLRSFSPVPRGYVI